MGGCGGLQNSQPCDPVEPAVEQALEVLSRRVEEGDEPDTSASPRRRARPE